MDPTCDPTLENIHGPDCVFEEGMTPPTKDPKVDANKGETGERTGDGGDSSSEDRSGEVAGILLGGVIAGLLATLIVVIVVLLYQRHKAQQ